MNPAHFSKNKIRKQNKKTPPNQDKKTKLLNTEPAAGLGKKSSTSSSSTFLSSTPELALRDNHILVSQSHQWKQSGGACLSRLTTAGTLPSFSVLCWVPRLARLDLALWMNTASPLSSCKCLHAESHAPQLAGFGWGLKEARETYRGNKHCCYR